MISVRDLTGKITSWIEIGTPDSARLHKASKAADRVAVYCHKEGAQWLKGLAAAGIHRADALELYAIDRALIAELVSRLDRRMAFGVSINDRELYVSIGDVNLTGRVERVDLISSTDYRINGSPPTALLAAALRAASPAKWHRQIRDDDGRRPATRATVIRAIRGSAVPGGLTRESRGIAGGCRSRTATRRCPSRDRQRATDRRRRSRSSSRARI